MKKIDKILNIIIWLIAIISLLGNMYLSKEIERLETENIRLTNEIQGGEINV